MPCDCSPPPCQRPWHRQPGAPLDFIGSLSMLIGLFGPKWRNWQTRMIQGHVPARVWGFESPLRHQYLHDIRPYGTTSCANSCAGSEVISAEVLTGVRERSVFATSLRRWWGARPQGDSGDNGDHAKEIWYAPRGQSAAHG